MTQEKIRRSRANIGATANDPQAENAPLFVVQVIDFTRNRHQDGNCASPR